MGTREISSPVQLGQTEVAYHLNRSGDDLRIRKHHGTELFLLDRHTGSAHEQEWEVGERQTMSQTKNAVWRSSRVSKCWAGCGILRVRAFPGTILRGKGAMVGEGESHGRDRSRGFLGYFPAFLYAFLYRARLNRGFPQEFHSTE